MKMCFDFVTGEKKVKRVKSGFLLVFLMKLADQTLRTCCITGVYCTNPPFTWKDSPPPKGVSQPRFNPGISQIQEVLPPGKM